MIKLLLKLLILVSLFLLSSCNFVDDYINENKTINAPIHNESSIDLGPLNGGTLNLMITEAEYNVLKSSDVYSFSLTTLIYQPLFQNKTDSKPVPILGEFYKSTQNNYIWTIQLKENVLWSDGTVLLPSDVVKTCEYINESYNSYYYNNISNVKKVYVNNDEDIVFELHSPDPFFIDKLDFPITKLTQNDYIGTGAYVIDSSTEDMISLKINPHYEDDDSISIENVYAVNKTHEEALRTIASKEIDIALVNSYSYYGYKSSTAASLYTNTGTLMELVVFNTESELLDDPLLRHAVAYAINRDNIISKLFQGRAQLFDYPVVNPNHYTSSELSNLIFNDFDKSIQLISDAGWEKKNNEYFKSVNNKKNKLSVKFIVCNQNHIRLKIAEEIKSNLESVGIGVELVILNNAKYDEALTEKEYDMTLIGYNTPYTPDFTIYTSELPNINLASYKNAYLENLNTQLQNSSVENGNNNILQRMYKVIIGDMPYFGILIHDEAVVATNRIKGILDPSANRLYNGIEKLYILE